MKVDESNGYSLHITPVYVVKSQVRGYFVLGRFAQEWTPHQRLATRLSREAAVKYARNQSAKVMRLKRRPGPAVFRPRTTFYPEGAFAPGELACIGQDPDVASSFYGGLVRVVERNKDRLGGSYWTCDMIEPYRNGRYEFREKYMMRVAPPLPSLGCTIHVTTQDRSEEP